MAEIFVVASGKGGVGKSSFVSGVAKALAEKEKKVLAIDCDIGLRSLDIMLECSDRVVFDWGDALAGRCEPEKAVISGSVDLMAAPRSYESVFTAENMKNLIALFSDKYDYIFFDAPAGIGTGFKLAASCADRAIAITTPDSVCVRSCARACDELRQMGIDNIRLIINMFEVKPVTRKKLLNLDECIDETCIQLLGVVPMDRALAFACVTGEEPGEFSPSNQAFWRIAGRITGKKVPLVCE